MYGRSNTNGQQRSSYGQGRNSYGGRSSYGGSFRGGQNRGQRRIKTFDPTFLVNAPVRDVAPKEYKIVNSFNDFKISEVLKRNIFEHGYKIPTPIQDQSIPAIIEGRDLIGIASTGTGKTAAFLIPLIDHVIKNRNHKALIVTPTRELAMQIQSEFFKFSRGLQIYSALCIGGTNIYRQKSDLQRSPNFVIGTPGRLRDLIETRNLDLSKFDSIVLDEADHMVDIGFIGEIKYFISLLPPQRLSLFFSATIDGKVREIIGSFVKNPVTVSVRAGETLSNIEQKIIKVNDTSKKAEMLTEILGQDGVDKVLIFGRTKHGVQDLSDRLGKLGFRTGAIHGNKNQSQRTKVLENFKRNNLDILIATDVAARGLDIPDVSHVINYDLPESQDAYTHRIGRTGRAGKCGLAITFV
jgi:superfamily II DNA/RNA helicase